MKTENTNKRFLIALAIVAGVLLSNVGMTGLPPTTFSSFLDTVKNTAFNLFVPNYQATKTDTGILYETGNKNILKNPSFEHSTAATSWTSGAGSASVETSNVVDGKKALKITLSSQILSVYQDSTLYASAFNGKVQGLASVRVYPSTNMTSVRLCARQVNTVASYSTLCSLPAIPDQWNLLKVPFTLSATANGLQIMSVDTAGNPVSGTGSVIIDDSFVGAVDLKVDGLNQSDYFSYRGLGSTWQDISNGEARLPASGYTFTNRGVFTIEDDAANTRTKFVAKQRATFIVDWQMAPNAAGHVLYLYKNGVVALNGSMQNSSGSYYVTGSWTVELQAGEYFTLAQSTASTGTEQTSLSITAMSAATASSYSSNNADTDWEVCTPTGSQGFGTATYEFRCKRQGSDLLMAGKLVAGTVSAVEARLNLPLWNGVQLQTANSSKIPSLRVVGKGAYSSAAAYNHLVLVEASKTFMNFGMGYASGDSYSKDNGDGIAATGTTIAIETRIPIDGWENSNIMVGQFNGLESCTDTWQCTDFYSATNSSGSTTITGENVPGWITGVTNPVAGRFVYTFKVGLFTATPNCIVSLGPFGGGGDYEIGINTLTKDSMTVDTYGSSASNLIHTVSCQKANADFLGKTAKAVASDQNLRTPGVSNVVIVSASIDTAGAVTEEDDNFINGTCPKTGTSSSITTCTFTTSYWAANPHCWAVPWNDSGESISQSIDTNSTTTFSTTGRSGVTPTNRKITLWCKGRKL